jgi:glyoxylase-like metal-dependent hydrolase (beta-lactamase superfamily II)
VRLIHPGRGHTDGDLVALFVEDKVLHTGDLFFNGRYPNIDLEAGGSIREWVAAIDRLLELDFDRVIPGHGRVTDREGLRAFQTFMRELADVGEQAVRQGWTLDQTEREAKLGADAGYEAMSIPFVLKVDRAFVVRARGKRRRASSSASVPEATQ